ncbi:MAG: DUF4942 domain-containing protein [Clostridia bacterium]|nr:DUF4942 domain-containing protein [Clostridia bacterium]
MNKAVVHYAEGGEEFYPTPAALIDRMLSGIDWRMIRNILEPSAGKGDIVLHILRKNYRDRYGDRENRFGGISVDCIELDPHLTSILKYNFSREKALIFQPTIDKYREMDYRKVTPEMQREQDTALREKHICESEAVHVVFDDFLQYEPFKEYDLIVMNPPFSNGCTHLLKALDIQKRGGSIVCLLNAETIRNPYTQQRKELRRLLDRYGASIEYIENAFVHAERQTDVEVALIKVCIPTVAEESDFYERMKKAEKLDDEYGANPSLELDVTDYIKSAVAHFRVETKAGLELIRQFRAFQPYMKKELNPKSPYGNDCILRLTDSSDRGYDSVSVNSYLEKTRLKYWSALLSNPKFIGKLTSKLQSEYREKVDRLKDYDFNEYNIQVLSVEIMAQVRTGIEDEIIAMFDRLTADHTWSPECANNRHYYDGWATNKAWKVNKKVIIPCYGLYDEYDGLPRKYKAVEVLSDIEKIFNFFDGHMTADVDLGSRIEDYFSRRETKNVPCKFFTATFYKKGTVHITFTCPELLERFNIYAAQNRGWLPPSYGKKKYADMNPGEKKVVDSFQGEKQYAKVLSNTNYYLASPVRVDTMPLLAGGMNES